MADSTGSYIVKALKPRERRFVDEFFQDFPALPGLGGAVQGHA